MKDWKEYDWSDITPVTHEDAQPALASIAYSPTYKEAMAYLRAVMAKNEKSERALAITTQVIHLNGAHYSVWDYRFEIVKEIGNDVFDYKKVGLIRGVKPLIGEDGDWLNEFTLDKPKNYQVWNYRQHLEVPGSKEYYQGERLAVKYVLDDDTKNFHAWSHLKWAVTQASKHDAPFELPDLLQLTDEFLQEDVYNNSSWSFRFFLYTLWPDLHVDKQAFDDEIAAVVAYIDVAPENEAAWSYLRGLYREFYPSKLQQAEPIARKYCASSSRAMELLAEIVGKTNKTEATALYSQLADKEPVRSGLWNYKKQLLA